LKDLFDSCPPSVLVIADEHAEDWKKELRKLGVQFCILEIYKNLSRHHVYRISLYLVKDMSPNDPYVIIESTESETSVIVIINLAHPHWSQLTNDESITNFIRHCTYDGVSEWKAYSATRKIEPDTVKFIKDNLLRIPLTMEDVQSQK
jgi:hypothetical protein